MFRERIVWICLSVILLILIAYLVHKSGGDVKIVTMPQTQAETSQGVKKAAESVLVTKLAEHQTEEIATKIKAAKEKVPDQIIFAKSNGMAEITQIAKENKVDFSIVTGKQSVENKETSGNTQLNVYNIKAFPRQMVGMGIGNKSQEVMYLQRIDAPRVPLLLPKGGVGYIGPYLRHDRSDGKLDIGVKLLIPL